MTQATLSLRAGQHTALTPRLQQSVRLLQLSSAEFAQELEQALATNPFLEILPFEGRTPSGNDPHAASDGTSRVYGLDDLHQTASGAEVCDEAAHEPEITTVADGDDPIVPELEHDPFASFGLFGDGSHSAKPSDIASWADARPGLRMHLHEELTGYRLCERDRTVAAMVIEALDDDGYLRQDLADVAERFDFDPPVDADELAIALALVRQLGPTGVAARDLAECLSLQLDAMARRGRGGRATHDAGVVTRAQAIVQEHLALLAARDGEGLKKRLACASHEVDEAAALIRRLDPRPASAFDGEMARTIVPDVIVRRANEGWRADINPAVIPRVALNRVYAALFHDSRVADRQPLGQQLQEARWLLRNAAQRFVTIRRVARVVVAEQAAFLDYGDIAIRPLLLRQVAGRLDLHESTVSRAIGNKFIATPRGVFAFKHFFSRELATATGGTCSATSIRAAMRELIDGEDALDPLSDVALARRLTDQGLCVARRTITKYRGLMRIPAVETRRNAR